VIASTELRHGYTLHDLDRVTRGVLRYSRIMIGHGDERYAVVHHGIVEALYASDGPVAENELFQAGQAALWKANAANRRLYGQAWIENGNGSGYGSVGSRLSFVKYWDGRQVTASPENPIVDRTALSQILPTLTSGQQAALIALAVHDDYAAAAASLGLPYGTFVSRVSVARERFLALWHEGEEPSKPWGRDRRRTVEFAEKKNLRSVLRRRGKQVSA
jgi:hypothetical protein